MRKRLMAGALVVSLIGALFGLIPGSQASTPSDPDCTADGPLKFQSLAGVFYIDDRDSLETGPKDGLWIYMESNDTADLQRGGPHFPVELNSDPCTDRDADGNPVVPDTLLY